MQVDPVKPVVQLQTPELEQEVPLEPRMLQAQAEHRREREKEVIEKGGRERERLRERHAQLQIVPFRK